MATQALSGKDTIVIDGHIFNDQSDDDVVTVTYPNDLATVKTGKNGTAIFGQNEGGRQADVTIKVIRGSADDKFLLARQTVQVADLASFTNMTGTFVKKIGDGKGNISNDTLILSGGVFSKYSETKSNVGGDTEQSSIMYHLKFANAIRVIS